MSVTFNWYWFSIAFSKEKRGKYADLEPNFIDLIWTFFPILNFIVFSWLIFDNPREFEYVNKSKRSLYKKIFRIK